MMRKNSFWQLLKLLVSAVAGLVTLMLVVVLALLAKRFSSSVVDGPDRSSDGDHQL